MLYVNFYSVAEYNSALLLKQRIKLILVDFPLLQNQAQYYTFQLCDQLNKSQVI